MIRLIPVLLLGLTAQVPPPDAASRTSESLRAEWQGLLDREAEQLRATAARLKEAGREEEAGQVGRLLPPPPDPSGAQRFEPLADVVPPRKTGPGLPNVRPAPGEGREWQKAVDAARAGTAKGLFALAGRAAEATPKHYGVADACLRGVIARDPDHAEARRLLGFVPHEGGWARPFAVQQFRDGKTFHALYGWVPTTWVPHLEKGELPARGRPGSKEVWLPADEANAQRAEIRNGWTIQTEHFAIRTNVPLAEAIAFGRHLESLHDLFGSLLADVIGENLPQAQRFKNRTLVGERSRPPHLISYFAEKEQFVEALRPYQGPEIEKSLGLYLPAARNARRGQAYFYRDQGGELAITATLYHEVSHQLLFESGVAGPNDYLRNDGNYWVFEGLGTYFETLTLDADGTIRVGGLVGARNEEARRTFAQPGRLTALGAFVRMDKPTFNGERGGDIYANYQQASALTSFLMHGRDGAYREGFLEYVRDACRGKVRRVSGRSLEDRVGAPYAALEAEFLAYLTRGGPAETEPRR